MELIAFGVAAVSLYFFSDWVLRRIEAVAGRRFEQRSLIFFAILLTSTLITFSVIRTLTSG